MNPDLDRLSPYPFERMARLLDGVEPPRDRAPIRLSIGEPQHAPPELATRALVEHVAGVGRYPATRGTADLRAAAADWLARRFALRAVDPDSELLPVAGTREALFAIAQAVVDRSRPAGAVLLPNPGYQIYEGAALLAGVEPARYPAGAATGPDLDAIPATVWDRCQLLYICNPGNPTGAVLDRATLAALIERAHRHDFVIAADECYAEIHPDEEQPPCGLLAAADGDFARCLVFHSLSKRSNLPGLRSGFVAGDARLIAAFARYRTYQGCALPPPTQAASAAVWRDEAHVRENRAAYRAKFDAVLPILADALDCPRPAGAFYCWPRIPGGDDERFCRELVRQQNVHAVPGRYLGRTVDGVNPGAGHVRLALVDGVERCVEAAQRIRRFVADGHH